MIRYLNIPVHPWQPEKADQYTHFAIVDSQPHHNKAFQPITFDCIIDHHPLPRSAGNIAACAAKVQPSFRDIRPGMLVGNSSAFTFLVHAETERNEYVAARPFRVNAGAVHAYVRLPGDKTTYLGEFKAGQEVLIVDANGETSLATLGRVKIEVRPMNFITSVAYFALLAGQEDLLPFLTPSFRRRQNAARKMLTEDARMIPEELYKAVAAVLASIWKLKPKVSKP